MTEIERPSLPQALPLLCICCGNEGFAMSEAGDKAPFSTSGDFFLRYLSIKSLSLQIVCGRCGRVHPLHPSIPAGADSRRVIATGSQTQGG
jgi:hypothetical protein